MRLKLPLNWKKPGQIPVVLLLAVIVVAIIAVSTIDWAQYGAEEDNYDWKSGKLGITNHRIIASGIDQVTVKNNEQFAILVRAAEINNVELLQGNYHLLQPAEAVTLVGEIGEGSKGDEFAYSVSIIYDDHDNEIAGYGFSPGSRLRGNLE